MSSGQSTQQLSTRFFTIYYPDGEATAAKWYAGFADDVDADVSKLLGSSPIRGLSLRIYATEAEFGQANPLAELHPGIMAHAIPEQKELGVAVERLRKEAPEVARDSFRHEMTHIVAGTLSNQNLPVGFQEGLAQYNEISTSRAKDVVDALQQAQASGVPLLSWKELNDPDLFRQDLNVAYPQSYTVMAFLAEKYGIGTYARFLKELETQPDFSRAIVAAYGVSMEKLQSEWQDYLPTFLKDGWQQNVLSLYELGPGIALYNVGRYAEAESYFGGSEHLYNDLGRSSKASEAGAYLDKASRARRADELAIKARQALEAYRYSVALGSANSALQAFAELKLQPLDGTPAARAAQVARLAAQGTGARKNLESARHDLQIFSLPQAQAEAESAAHVLAQLGDGPGVAEANTLLSELWRRQRLAGASALGAGASVIALGAFATMRRRKWAMLSRSELQVSRGESSWL